MREIFRPEPAVDVEREVEERQARVQNQRLDGLRSQALNLAAMKHDNPIEVVDTANRFYMFLRGDAPVSPPAGAPLEDPFNELALRRLGMSMEDGGRDDAS